MASPRHLLAGSALTLALVLAGPHPAAGEASGPSGGAPHLAEVAPSISVTRPPGTIALGGVSIDGRGHLDLVVVDTRGEDPGWSVVVTSSRGVSPSSVTPSAPFIDSAGRRYAAEAGRAPTSGGIGGHVTLAVAPAHHGLGITRVEADLGAPAADSGRPVVTITVI